VHTLPDPRTFPLSPGPASAEALRWNEWAQARLGAATGREAAAADAQLHAVMLRALAEGDLAAVEGALGAAPSPVAYRHLLRALDAAWLDPALDRDEALVLHGFAIPLVIVAAADTGLELPAILEDGADALAAVVREHRGLAGNDNFALANVLAGAHAVGVGALRRWLEWRRAIGGAAPLRDVQPAAIRIAPGQEGAHLRFLVGVARAARGAPLLAREPGKGWASGFARELIGQMAAPGLQILPLAQAPADPLLAAQRGASAHREVALQLFAASAIRALRASFGEPSAVISAHVADGSGELRLSLSSVFGERDAEGFRCPLFPSDRVDDVLSLIVDLLRDCRISDIRIVRGIQPDRASDTGLPLLFRADAIGPGDAVPFH
jgi:hypothetical protein